MPGGDTLCPWGKGSWPFCFGQENVFYLKNHEVYNTLCPANSYNGNLGRTKIINTTTHRKKNPTHKLKHRSFIIRKKD